MTSGMERFWPQGHNLNNVEGPPAEATYQMSKIQAF